MESNSRKATAMAMLVLVLCVSALPVNGQVYKCKDASGATVYSGKPCEFEAKALDLADNAVQGGRTPDDAYAPSAKRGTSPSTVAPEQTSPKCKEMHNELEEIARATPPSGIVDGYRERNKFNRLSKLYESTCGGGGNGGGAGTRKEKKPAQGGDTDATGGVALTKCIDGAYVSGTWCQACPDGSYVAGGKGCRQAPDGKYVQDGKPPTLSPDGTYVAGSCVRGPNGKYYGQ